MIDRLIGPAMRTPKLVLVLVGIGFVVCGALGSQAAGRLSNGGFVATDSESARAADILGRDYGISGAQLVFTVESPGGAAGPAATTRGRQIAQRLAGDPRVSGVMSPWTAPIPNNKALVSSDGRIGLIVATVRGDENSVPAVAHELAAEFTGSSADIAARGGDAVVGQGDAAVGPGSDFTNRQGEATGPAGEVTVRAGGQAMVWRETGQQTQRDLAVAEAIALPLTFLLLVWFLRSPVAALIPFLTGVVAIAGASAVLYLMTFAVQLSVFALNITTAIGLALAIDYSLLIIGRYREEIARGRDRTEALTVAMRRGGRAVSFSGTTVGIALIGMLFFPMAFLRSLASAGLAVVALSIGLALTMVPALLVLLGDRINRKPLREAAPVERGLLYRVARGVQRRPALCAFPVLALLLLLGSPIVGLRLGLPDDRVLPGTLESRQVGDLLRNRFDDNATGAVQILVRGQGIDVSAYAAALSRVPEVESVIGPTGTFAYETPVGPGDPTAVGPDTVHLTVTTRLDPYSGAAQRQLDALHAVGAPAPVLFGGLAQQTADAGAGIAQGIPKAITWIAIVTFVLLLLLTGSVVLPLKALVLNTLSLSATFGALVWIFQWGHLGGLGTLTTGYTIGTLPVLLFCVAFGLSMDYEVFLLARFTEEWDNSAKTRADNDNAVALGIARSGRIVTAAALLMAVVFAGIAASGVTMNRMLGVGLALAVLMDATLVRMVLVPAFMRVMGTANWWAPTRTRPLLERAALRE
ncbi:MMPL family transporter [Nocardia sp. CDC160]|uniref:MMPL family transporter n=1 Tax=Nocardia sp. CDC160 TaxID=3112166 RepID=UPI002DB9DEC0|nr:MMPL family transporter [Nocardia sp. CDC160]MEC3918624.1 MMPL family transporter [Nocardia sp. CDC160]